MVANVCRGKRRCDLFVQLLVSLWDSLRSSKLQRSLLNVEGTETIEAGPNAILRFQIGKHRLGECIAALSCSLLLFDALAQARQILAERSHIRCTGYIAVPRDECGIGMRR